MYICNYYIYFPLPALNGDVTAAFCAEAAVSAQNRGTLQHQEFPLAAFKPSINAVCNEPLVLPSAAESGIERHAFQDGVRGVSAEFTSYSHHPDCAHHSCHAGTVGHHYHEHAQRRTHPEAVLGQVQRPHLFRYKGVLLAQPPPRARPAASGCGDNRTTALI